MYRKREGEEEEEAKAARKESERNAHMCSFVTKPRTRGERIVCFAIQLKCALETVTASG